MQNWGFTVILTPLEDHFDKVIDLLYKSGCDDATIAVRYPLFEIIFDRNGESLDVAIKSALIDIENATIGSEVLRVEISLDNIKDWNKNKE